MKKIVIGLLLTICVFLSTSTKADACVPNPNCVAELIRVDCINQHGVPQFTHYLRGANNHIYVCGVTNEYAYHDVTCGGCGYVFKSSEYRQCSELHSHSFCESSIYGMCQHY